MIYNDGYYSSDVSGYSQSINPGVPVLQPILTATGQIVYLSDKGLVTAAAPDPYMYYFFDPKYINCVIYFFL